MTISVQGPDGSTFEFPDGTTQDVVGNAVRRHYGTAAAPPAVSAPANPAAPVADAVPEIDPGDPRFTQQAIEAKQAIRGVPILGPAVAERASAAASALAQPMTGAGSPGETYHDRYTKNLAQEIKAREAYEAAHPVRSTIIQGVGGTVALGGVGGAIPGAARVLGMTGRLASAVPFGALSGAGIGAADAAARGEDPTRGAISGALTGGAGVLGGKAVGKVFDKAAGVFRDRLPNEIPNVAGVNVPVRESVLTGDRGTSREEQRLLAMGQPDAVAADASTNQAMGQAHSNLAAQLDPTGQSPGVTFPHEGGEAAVSDLVSQEQARAAAETARILGARGQTAQLATGFGGAAQPTTIGDVGSTISQRIRDLFTGARQATRAAYDASAQVPAVYNPRYLLRAGDDIRASLDAQPGQVKIKPAVTPHASNALDTINEEISRLGMLTTDQTRGVGNAITPADMEMVRKQLVIQRGMANAAARASGNYEDARAVGRVIDAFDDWQEATARRQGGLLSGNPEDVINAQQAARLAHSWERARFSRRQAGDVVGNFMEKAVGKVPGQEMSPEKILGSLYGKPGGTVPENAVPILTHLRDNVFGANSPEWGAVKRGAMLNLSRVKPGAEPISSADLADRIDNFLENDRHASTLLDPNERAQLQQHADNLRGVEDIMPARGTVAQTIAQLSGRVTGEEASGQQLISQLMGKRGPELARALRQPGALTPEGLGQLKQGIWRSVSEEPEGGKPWEHQKINTQITRLLNNPMARELFTPNELQVMKAIADAHLQLIPVPGTTNPSGTAFMGQHMMKGMTKQLLRMFGLSHGGLPGMVAGHVAGMGWEALARRMEAAQARNLFLGRKPVYAVPGAQRAGATIGQALRLPDQSSQ